MPSPLPREVVVAPGQVLKVTEVESVGDVYGCCDFRRQEIQISSRLHPVEKHLILLHELIHIAGEKLKLSGVVKRQPPEEYTTELAGVLFLMLAYSGLWNGVTPEEAKEYVESLGKEGE